MDWPAQTYGFNYPQTGVEQKTPSDVTVSINGVELGTLHLPDDPADLPARIEELRSEMLLAAEELEFEKAAELRDQVEQLRAQLKPGTPKSPKRDRRSQRPRR